MSRESTILSALSSEPTGTSTLYRRVGYASLVQVGLVSYDAFRAELVKLAAAGLVERTTGRDGSTEWRLPAPDAPAG